MTVTLLIDDALVDKAKRRAQALGKSLDEAVREYLEQLASEDDAERDIAEFRRLSEQGTGDSHGRRWTRDELHDRR
jgi:hypothetical protein